LTQNLQQYNYFLFQFMVNSNTEDPALNEHKTLDFSILLFTCTQHCLGTSTVTEQ
jgi:hypothetical protein